jgi:Sulfatase
LRETSSGLRIILAALGLTTIYLAQLVEPLVRPSHNLVYHWSGRPLALFGPAVIEVLVLLLLLSVLLFSAEYGRAWRSAVWATVLLTLPWVVFPQIDKIRPGTMPHWFRLPPFYVVVVACPLLIVLWSRYAPKLREQVIESATLVLAFTALSSALFMGQLLWFWWKARALNQPLPLHQPREVAAANGSRQAPRIIWILLDELSQEQLYEHRYSGLQLPAFDALAANSTVFTDVVPTANYTERAVPSLLSGHEVVADRSTADGMLVVRGPQAGSWHRFDEHDTVFQDALNAGYSTAVAGWYNPYCRLLNDVLDSCYWTDDYTVKNGLLSDGTVESNLASSVDERLEPVAPRKLLQWTLHVPADVENRTGGAHLQDYRDLLQAGDKLLLDRSAGFVFLHLPIPHPHGIYDRRSHRFTTSDSTYIDNLVLSDEYLAHVRQLLESSGQWDSSVILVMGDHGWRTGFLWDTYPGWAPEEQQASPARYDQRPGYIVKLAGQNSGTRIDEPFSAIRTRALVDELLAGEIQSPDQLKEWVDKQHAKEQVASGD